MANYNNTIVYKLCCKDTDITDIYIGSTCNFARRKQQHKSLVKTGNGQSTCYEFIRQNGGWENWDMVLIKQVSCTNKLEKLRAERECIEELKPTLNKLRPIISLDEKRETHKELKKKWVDENRDYVKDCQQKWRDVHPEYHKKWRNDNPEYDKKWYLSKKLSNETIEVSDNSEVILHMCSECRLFKASPDMLNSDSCKDCYILVNGCVHHKKRYLECPNNI